MLQVGEEFDKYLVLNSLGGGNFGQVFHVLDRNLDVEKAIKILDVDQPDQFLEKLEEARILQKCKHKHIVEINEANVFQLKGVPKVVIDMEYIAKGSLESHIQTAFVSVVDAMKIICGVLYGLEHAHHQDILHRDIKPANILLDDIYPKLSDFGLATVLGNNFYGSGQGYITHLAPEVFSTFKTSILTDIYAVGITFFRIVNNIKDWDAALPVLQRERILRDCKIIRVLGYWDYIPPQIKNIINKACNADPSRRYQCASDMRQAIERLKPGIRWIKSSPCHWEGQSCISEDTFDLRIYLGRVRRVEVKRNNRAIRQECVALKNEEQCLKYANGYIASRTLL